LLTPDELDASQSASKRRHPHLRPELVRPELGPAAPAFARSRDAAVPNRTYAS